MPPRNTGVGPAAPLPTKEYHLDTSVEEYDLNFCFPVPEDGLRAPGVHLEPFIPSVHGSPVWDLLSHLSPERRTALFSFLPFPTPNTLAEFLTLVELRLHSLRGSVLFVISDTSRECRADQPGGGRYAGWIGLINASPDDFVAEIGHVVILPRAQRSHVTTNACAALAKWSLTPPSEGGLGLRRLQYCAHLHNVASNNVCDFFNGPLVPPRFGFTREGVIRCHRALPPGKPGDDVDPDAKQLGHPEAGKSRDTALWSITWKDWRDGAREKVEHLLARPVQDQPAFAS